MEGGESGDGGRGELRSTRPRGWEVKGHPNGLKRTGTAKWLGYIGKSSPAPGREMFRVGVCTLSIPYNR